MISLCLFFLLPRGMFPYSLASHWKSAPASTPIKDRSENHIHSTSKPGKSPLSNLTLTVDLSYEETHLYKVPDIANFEGTAEWTSPCISRLSSIIPPPKGWRSTPSMHILWPVNRSNNYIHDQRELILERMIWRDEYDGFSRGRWAEWTGRPVFPHPMVVCTCLLGERIYNHLLWILLWSSEGRCHDMYSSLARHSSTAFQTASQSNVGGWVGIRNNFMD